MSFKPQKRFNPRYIDRKHIGERNIDDETIGKMFSIALEGDIDKINTAVQENGVTFNIRDGSGNSVLHVVLDDDGGSLSDNQRFAVVRKLIELGAPVDVNNSSNITPLHLACKNQYESVVQLLLEKGAVSNKTNNDGMNPLHYTILGKLTKCKESKKIKSIVPKGRPETDVTRRVKTVMVNTIDLFFTPDFRKYIKHITKSLDQFADLYPNEYGRLSNDYRNFINDIDITVTDQQKSTMIDRKITEMIDTIKNTISSDINQSVRDIAIDTKNGFEVADGIKILDKDMIPEKMLRKTRGSVDNIYRKTVGEIDTNINGLVDSSDEMEGNIKGGLQRMEEIYQHIVHYDRENETGENTRFNEFYRDNKYRPGQPLFYNPSINLIGPMYPNRDFMSKKLTDQVQVIKYSQSQQSRWNSADRRNLGQPDVLRSPEGAGNPELDIQFIGDRAPDIDIPRIDHRGGVDSYNYYYLSRLVYCVSMVKYFTARIREVHEELKIALETNLSFSIYDNLISVIILFVLNICQHLNMGLQEKNYMIQKTTDIVNYTNTMVSNNINNQFVYDLEISAMHAGEIRDIIQTTYGKFNTFYGELNNLIGNLNKTIKVINLKSFSNVIGAYYATPFKNDNTGAVVDSFDRIIPNIKELPNTLEKYLDLVERDLGTRAREILIKEFIPQIHYYNNPYYILDRPANAGNRLPPPPVRNGKVGFINIPDVRRMRIDPDLKHPNVGIDARLEAPDVTKIGRIGLVDSYANPKKRGIIPSVGKNMDTHLTILKHYLIQHILMVYKHTDSVDAGGQRLLDDNYANRTQQIIDSNTEAGNPASHERFLVTVARLTDRLIKRHITHSINKAAINGALDIANVQTDVENYKDILKNITNRRHPYTVEGDDTGFSLDLREIVADIIDGYVDSLTGNNPLNPEILGYTNLPIELEEEPEKKQHEVYNIDYSLTNPILERQCYKIKPYIIDLLLNARIDVNQTNSLGFSPLYYAIQIQHTDTVRKLLDNGASIKTRNREGYDALDFAHKLYQAHFNYFTDQSGSASGLPFYQDLLEDSKKFIKSKPEYKNNIIRFMNIIYPQVLAMYNHMFYLKAKAYQRGWTYEDQTQLETALTEANVLVNDDIPLLYVEDNVVRNNTNLHVLNAQTSRITKERVQVDQQLNEVSDRVRSLNTDLGTAGNDINRRRAIMRRLHEARREEATLRASIGDLDQTYNTMTQVLDRDAITVNTGLQQRIANFKNSSKRYDSSTSAELYDNIFSHVINSTNIANKHKYSNLDDFVLYNQMWENYLNSDLTRHVTNILTVTSYTRYPELQSRLYGKLVVPFINDLQTLPQFMDENPFLREVFQIMVHVTRHTVCSAFYGALTKALTKYLQTVKPNRTLDNPIAVYDDQYTNVLTRTLGSILAEGDGRIVNHIIRDMPEKLVKLIADIYDSEYDNDKSIRSVDELFNQIIDNLKRSTVVQIDNNSSIVTNLKTYLFPYFKDISTDVITKMKVLLDNYNRYLVVTHRHVEILRLLENKQ